MLAIGWLLWIYDAITNLAPLRLHVALAHAASVLNLERALHLDPELGLDHWLAARHALGLAISDYYDNAHFIVTLGILGWLWWSRSDYYRPLRNALVLVNLIAFAIFWRFPVAPPRMLPGFTDVVSSTGAIGSWHSGALASHANELAAMPSLHMAWAGWCAVALWAVSRRWWVRALGVAHLLLTAFAVISTGNHFLLDVIAGLAVLGVSLAAVSGLGALTARRSAPAPAASP